MIKVREKMKEEERKAREAKGEENQLHHEQSMQNRFQFLTKFVNHYSQKICTKSKKPKSQNRKPFEDSIFIDYQEY